MTTLTKDEVISSLKAVLEKQTGKAVSIEQSGSWYKIDGGKSVRFSELEAKLAQLSDAAGTEVTVDSTPAKTKKPAKAETEREGEGEGEGEATKTATSENTQSVGLTPKQLWRAKLAQASGKQTLPRGF
ncbi:hypothetical protein [Shewanella aestuarii]|uniref:Uncharacterized protein n=1 Tax=Shewanella aestuarii TaxID=1028752 RepID=A0A6G9QJM8_9GAMM|nr:hypothetical protein [Shewanella aestuarii]QIR14760.1 hypothetical protein HBH39_09915 [Shewanella aestuarii]